MEINIGRQVHCQCCGYVGARGADIWDTSDGKQLCAACWYIPRNKLADGTTADPKDVRFADVRVVDLILVLRCVFLQAVKEMVRPPETPRLDPELLKIVTKTK